MDEKVTDQLYDGILFGFQCEAELSGYDEKIRCSRIKFNFQITFICGIIE